MYIYIYINIQHIYTVCIYIWYMLHMLQYSEDMKFPFGPWRHAWPIFFRRKLLSSERVFFATRGAFFDTNPNKALFYRKIPWKLKYICQIGSFPQGSGWTLKTFETTNQICMVWSPKKYVLFFCYQERYHPSQQPFECETPSERKVSLGILY